VFGTVASSLQLAQEGRVRAIAVSSVTRLPGLPDVGTVAEQGFPGYELNEWNGLYAPAGLPAAAVQRWHGAVRQALADPAVRRRLDALGAIPLGTDPEAFARYVREQREAMARLVREARIELG
jgi:tripartite-type tricarboxylate transporter receptor subunit TctC